jgi:hypothetical protein
VRFIGQSNVQDLGHVPDEVDLELGPHFGRHVLQELSLILPGQDDGRQAGRIA